MTTSHLLIRAARGEPVERPPVWAMRQAGRWDPEFQRIRAARPFFDFNLDAEASAQVTLAPRRFGVDAIILFYDITTLPIAMGLPFTLEPGRGPVPDRPIHTATDLDRLTANPEPDSYQHILDLLRIVRQELDGALPVLAFAGAPFTVATYCIGTGKDIAATRTFITERPAVWRGLNDRLSAATVGFLQTMIAHGAQAVQLFDSWAGSLTPAEYDLWAQEPHRQILGELSGVPRILYVKECPYLERMTQTGAEVISLGTSHDLAAARRDYPHLVFQGNVSDELLRDGTPDEVTAATRACLAAGGGQRHIVNLSHGCDRRTPVTNFEAYIRAVRGDDFNRR